MLWLLCATLFSWQTAHAADTVRNTATVSVPSTGYDPAAGNNTAIDSVTVLGAILAKDDEFPPLIGEQNATTASVLANDTLGGVPASVGSGGNVQLKPGASPNPKLSMNADGTISVAAGTAAGTYTYPYQICDLTSPTNCASAVATITVTAAPIVAAPDIYADINGYSGGKTATVTANDTLNSRPVSIGKDANVTLKPGTSPSPKLLMNTDGTINIAPGTPSGSYQYPYTICEILNPDNCSSTVATIAVDAAPIQALPDSGTTPQNTPITTAVLDNDTLNGARVEPVSVAITLKAQPSNGTAVLAANSQIEYTPNPNYTGPDSYTYQICEVLNPNNCATATVSIVVAPNTVHAVDDVANTPANTPVQIPVLDNDSSVSAPLNPGSVTITTPPGNGGTATVNADGIVSYTPGLNYLGEDTFSYQVCDTSHPVAVCGTATVTVSVTGSPPVANDVEAVGDSGKPLVVPVLNNDTDPDNNIDPSTVLIVGSPDGKSLAVPEGRWQVNADGTITFTPIPGFVGNVPPIQYTVDDTTHLRSNPAQVRISLTGSVQLRVTKTATPRDVRIGDLVRYTVNVENIGSVDAVDATVIDTPAPGFSYVANSLAVADDDGAGRLIGSNPIRIDQFDLAIGKRATITYLLRVGAGVRPGTHINRVLIQDKGTTISNEATAEVRLISDPLMDDSLIIGTVFDDRNGNGWQDSAALHGVRIKGGFAADLLIPGTTTIDLGQGPKPLSGNAGTLLKGIKLGTLQGRASEADPAAKVVISQLLKDVRFTGDFELVSDEGFTVQMDAEGNNQILRSKRAAKGLGAGMPVVQRRISQVPQGIRVDYIIRNEGIDERGIPGVRVASAEGLLMETDQFGRYHLVGINGGDWERGRNFILKVDPATLPPGTTITTDNPLVRRLTPGVPVRFDFGAKLPPGLIKAPSDIKMSLDDVVFAPGSAEIAPAYAPVIQSMADRINAHKGGEITITADGETEVLAYARAKAIQDAVQAKLSAEHATDLKFVVRTQVQGKALVKLGESIQLGTILFDTDKSTIKPRYDALLAQIASDIERGDGGAISVVGNADIRGSDDYNMRLSMARAKAVLQAIKTKLSPAVQDKLEVRIDPVVPGTGHSNGDVQ